MKKISAFFLLILFACSIINPTIGESFLPSLDKVFGISMPLVSKIIEHEPSNSRINGEGLTVVEYTDISNDEYTKIGKSFMKSGFSLSETNLRKNVIQLSIQKDNKTIDISYDITKKTLEVILPEYYTEDLECYFAENEQSLFPDIEEMTGPILPRLSATLMREPDIIRDNNGKYTEEYHGFSEEDYKLVSGYLLQKGCEVRDYTKEGNILTIVLMKKNDTFNLIYDPDNHVATMAYDNNAYIEPMVTNTPKPTNTPRPTNTPATTFPPEYYNEYACIYVMYVKMVISDTYPDLLKIYSIDVMRYKGELFLVIDMSGRDDTGSYFRGSVSFRLVWGSILSSDEDFEAFDLYEKHKKDFKLVKSLNVDEVMELVNK